MQCRKVSSSICSAIDRMNRNFLWGRTESYSRLHLNNWATISHSKRVGGLGIRQVKAQNKAHLSKFCRHLVNSSFDLWAQILQAKYLSSPNTKSNTSVTWKALKSVQHIIENGVRWIIKDGSLIYDPSSLMKITAWLKIFILVLTIPLLTF
ncbi:hypothetical protein J1N35_042514 [Gossypium stocksii]|uniref:Reverse transcriptase zinc-binding domain-containing protein n=1 Tax=Gossypium stocksii TaxID=47602 RepID=A0A9D3U5L9_9ROSI|nr:hypothetical protein J1N35_042514 [Gossypium stocksii]